MHLQKLNFSDLIIEGSIAFLKNYDGSKKLTPVPPQIVMQEVLPLVKVLDTEPENDFTYIHDGISYRVSRAVLPYGKNLYCLRRGTSAITKFDELKFPPVLKKAMMKFTKGLVIFSGSMGSGKTTSASAYISEWLETNGGMGLCIENPPELPLHGMHGSGYCAQIGIREGESFAEEIVRSLRRAPEIIFLGEIRRPTEASEAVRVAESGCIVVTTFHADGVISTIRRFLGLIKETDGDFAYEMLAGGLEAIIHQELLDKKPRELRVNHLFMTPLDSTNKSALRAKIRSGTIDTLSTDVDNQKQDLIRRSGGNRKQ